MNSLFSATGQVRVALKENQDNDIDRIIKISDKMMYQDKAKYYESQGIERRTK